MRVHLVRHGEAAQTSPDGERALTSAGRDEVARLADWCAGNGVAPEEIRHSGLRRAQETAEILASRLSPQRGARQVRGLTPDDDPAAIGAELAHETDTIFVVTHMPLVGRLAALLSGRRSTIPFSTGQIACFDRDGAGFRLVQTWSPGEAGDA
jgi:phosphohistidine phosphatase SixA